MDDIVYQIEPSLSADVFVDVLRRSTLAERRPVTDAVVIAGMRQHESCWVSDRAPPAHAPDAEPVTPADGRGR